MVYGDFFKGKRVAIVGLGPEGQMRADARFLVSCGAVLSIYDERGKAAVSRIVSDLKAAGVSSWRLGLSDSKLWADELAGYDIVILEYHTPRSADFLRPAKAKGLVIEYPDILALKLCPAVTMVGVMGAYGKSAMLAMLSAAVGRSFRSSGAMRPVILDMKSPTGSLAQLPKIKKDGMVIVLMSDAMLPEYAKARQSPQVALMASLPAIPEPFSALVYQTHNSFLVTTDEIADMIHDRGGEGIRSKIIRTRRSRLPADWHLPAMGEHELEDAAIVLEAAGLFKVGEADVRIAVAEYASKRNVAGMRPVKKIKGVEFYNDAFADRPEATLAALRSLSSHDQGVPGGIILIMGGAETGADYRDFLKNLSNYARAVVLVPGSGTAVLRKSLASIKGLSVASSPSLEAAVKAARAEARPGDRVLYSPGFAAAGLDLSRTARSDRFVRAVRGLW